MKPLLIGAVLLTAACAAVGSKVTQQQAECESAHPEFIIFVECLRVTMQGMTNGRDGDLVLLYLAEAGLLAVKVEYSQIDEESARYELEKKLAFLQRTSRNRDSARLAGFGQGLTNASQNMRAASPRQTTTNCTILFRDTIRCTTR